MSKLTVIFVLISIGLCGCNHVDRITIRANSENIITKSVFKDMNPPLKFSRGKFTDSRPVITYIAKWSQGLNKFTILAKSPIEETIYDGLKSLIMRSGVPWLLKDSADILINVTLLNTQAAREDGLFILTVKSSIQMQIEYVNSKTGKKLYSNIYNGSNEDDGLIMTINDVEKSFNESLVNCINAAGNDKELRENLYKLNK